MTDRQPTSIRRRAFLSRLLTTTSLVATGAALSPAWGQSHGSHGAPRVRVAAAPAPTATPAPSPAPGPAFLNPPAIANIPNSPSGSYALNVVSLQTNLGTQPINVMAYVDPNNPPIPGAPLVAPTITIQNNGRPPQNQPSQLVSVQLSNLYPYSDPANLTPGLVTSPTVVETPHGFYTTNLHVHGLHVDPLEDNVYIELQPLANGLSAGAACAPTTANPVAVCNYQYTYAYNFGKTPTGTTSIPAGTYWYHPHKHGAVSLQVGSGMAGAFIVKGDLDNIPGVAGLTENVMVAQCVEYTTYNNSVGAPQPAPAIVDPTIMYNGAQSNVQVNTQISINGQINPTVTMQYGQIQRWRFINATADQFFYLSLAQLTGPTTAAPQLYAIAVDGVPLTNAPAPGITVPFALGTPQVLPAVPPSPITPAVIATTIMNEIAVLAPAQRLDLLVQAPAQPSAGPPGAPQVTYALQAVQWLGGNSGTPTTSTIATVAMGATKSPADTLPASSSFNAQALYRPPLVASTAWPTTPTQNIQFGFIYNGATGAVVNGTGANPFGVYPTPTPPPPLPAVAATPFALPLPTPTSAQLNLKLNSSATPNQGIDLWQVGTDPNYGGGPHAFHIHINSFMMTQRNGVGIAAAGIWRDTVRIDQGAGTPTTGPTPPQPSVRFVSQQVDYTGSFVLHCHVLEHEDSGMMWSVNISS